VAVLLLIAVVRVLAVILSEAKDPDALRPASYPRTFLPRLPPRWLYLAVDTKIKFKKLACFPTANLLSFQPRFHHKSTTIYHAKNHVLHARTCKTPGKNAIFASLEKNKKKKTPKPCCGSGVIGLQAARKPNSVLDDHSSTRRITAAL
jgi:hypothetical protein